MTRLLFVLILLPLTVAGCFLGGSKRAEVVTPTGEAEPDKILYEKSLKDLEKGRYDVARLTLQALLNTYPDSDYKEKAHERGCRRCANAHRFDALQSDGKAGPGRNAGEGGRKRTQGVPRGIS
jgi:hypothetical protein